MGAVLSAFTYFDQRNTILKDMASDENYISIAKTITKGNQFWSDLYQELFLHLSEMDAEKLIEITDKGYMRFYCVRFFTNQYCSDRSPFYRNYKNFVLKNSFESFEDKLSDLDRTDKHKIELDQRRIDLIESTLNSLTWYERELWRFRAENNMSYDKMNEQIGIPRSSLVDTCLKVERLIKKNLKEAGLYD